MINEESKKQIIKSSSIIGAATIITIVIGLIKMKTLAVIAGPESVGLMGMLFSLLAIGTTIFGLGLTTSTVREIAINLKDKKKVSCIRTVIFLSNFCLGLMALFVIIYFKKELSKLVFNNYDNEITVCFVGVSIFITLISMTQDAVLQGYRQVKELAIVSTSGSLISTVIGLLVVWYFGINGILSFIILAPSIGCLLNFYYVRKLPKVSDKFCWQNAWRIWKVLVTLGFVCMLSGIVAELTKLLVRQIIIQDSGLKAVGYFQAAWSISMTYISFALGAMASDYYPRLSQVINNFTKINKLINQQTEISLSIAAPIIIFMLSFTPWVIYTLYSSQFEVSINILRWQVLGDILKVAAWPMAYLLLVLGKGKLYLFVEFVWNIFYLSLIRYGLYYFDIAVTGYAFFIAYAVYLLVLYYIVNKTTLFSWSKKVKIVLLYLLFSSIIIIGLSYYSLTASMLIGSVFTLGGIFIFINLMRCLDSTSTKYFSIIYRIKNHLKFGK